MVDRAMSRMLEANALECVRGGRRLFQNLSFSLEPGELLEVSGANGSGKTSLLRMLCCLLAPAAGEILWQSKPINALKEEYLKELAYLGHANGVKAELSASENLRIHGGTSGAQVDDERLHMILKRMGLDGSERLPAKALSQGQQRRLALARLIINERALWILDEPLAALDSAAVGLVQSVLEEQLERGGLIVLTTHQPLNVRARSTKRITLRPSSEH